jgi:hypothetical protein
MSLLMALLGHFAKKGFGSAIESKADVILPPPTQLPPALPLAIVRR